MAKFCQVVKSADGEKILLCLGLWLVTNSVNLQKCEMLMISWSSLTVSEVDT